MAQPQQQAYPFDIPSISYLHPGIPAQIVHTLHFDENIAIGDPIDLLNVKRAQGAASYLAHLQVDEQAITDEVVEKPRIVPLLSGPHVSSRLYGQLEFHQGGNAAVLALLNNVNNTVNIMHNEITGLGQRLSRMEVMMENARIVKKNQHIRSLGPGQAFVLRRKEVIGSGTVLAQQIHGGVVLPPNVDIHPPADVGTAPANLNPYTATGDDILRLISFYNDTFEIIVGVDVTVAAHREKLIHWLTESFF